MTSINEQSTQIAITPQNIQHLRTRLQGSAFVPGDDDYDKVRLAWDTLNIDQYPALVVLPANTADVSIAVTFAREHHLPIAVRGGGHGHLAPANSTLLINFAQMTEIQIDQESSTVHVDPGVKFIDLIQATHPFGLAPLNGYDPTVGVVGYMLGGGTGWLARQYGPGAGSIRSLEVVTTNGQILHVNEANYPDLFWGIRGGGGNFGIVTSLELALYPVKEVFGGQVIYSVTDGKQVINAYLEWVKSVPDELTSALRITHFPPLPEVPAVLRGKSVVILMACYNGNASIGESLLQPIRILATPILDTFASLPYSQIATIANDPVDLPPLLFDATTGSFQEILPADVDAILAVDSDPTSGLMILEIRHLGGAYARLSEDTMAFHFSPNFAFLVVAAGPTTEALEAGKQSLRAISQALQPRMTSEVLINFMIANDVSAARTRAAFSPASYERLVALKDQYDPENMLCFNCNIPPSSKAL